MKEKIDKFGFIENFQACKWFCGLKHSSLSLVTWIWFLGHGGRWELSPVSCALTIICTLLHRHAHTCIHTLNKPINKCNKIVISKPCNNGNLSLLPAIVWIRIVPISSDIWLLSPQLMVPYSGFGLGEGNMSLEVLFGGLNTCFELTLSAACLCLTWTLSLLFQSPCLPAAMFSHGDDDDFYPSGAMRGNKASFCKLIWSWCFITTVKHWLT